MQDASSNAVVDVDRPRRCNREFFVYAVDKTSKHYNGAETEITKNNDMDNFEFMYISYKVYVLCNSALSKLYNIIF